MPPRLPGYAAAAAGSSAAPPALLPRARALREMQMRSGPFVVPMLVSVSAGLAFATCCFPLLGQAVSRVGLWVVPAILISALLCAGVALAYAELCCLLPTASGVRTYVSRAFHPVAGMTVALLYLPLIVSLGAAETYVLSQVLSVVFPGIPSFAVILGFVIFCIGANVVGLQMSGRLQSAMTFTVMGSLGGYLGLLLYERGPAIQLSAETAPDLGGGVMALAGVTFLFVGFEWVVSTVEEIEDRARVMPRALLGGVGLLAAVYLLLGAAMAIAAPGDQLLVSPVPHIVLAEAIGSREALVFFAAISAVATVTSFNSGILGASRLVYALSREGVLPKALSSLNPRFLTPQRAVVAVGLAIILSALTLAKTAAFVVPVVFSASVECFVFALVLLALVRLRRLEPTLSRPFRAPLSAPVCYALSVIFFLLCLACLVSVAEYASVVVALTAGATVAAYLYSRRVHARHEAERLARLERRKARKAGAPSPRSSDQHPPVKPAAVVGTPGVQG